MSTYTLRRGLLSALAALGVFAPAAAAAEKPEPNAVLVITASARDYLFGAGGTLAKMIEQGRPVYVLQFGNDEKDSTGLGPAATRLANNEEGERAARQLGVKEVLNLGHKSGELAYISSSEMRNQVMTMVRFYKPQTMFFPDWYAHYLNDDDVYRVGRMAEEAPYGGGGYFVQEMTYIGYGGYAAREYYFYIPHRPYRPREGGEGQAQLRHMDIGSTFDRKVRAILELKTSNSRYALQTRQRLDLAGRPHELLRELNENSTVQLIRAYLEDLAAAVGLKHGLRHAEEFNYLGRATGLPEHIREHARPAAQAAPLTGDTPR
ncbi:MAG: PIG-L family deacetylase [Bryobacterales bacterium]